MTAICEAVDELSAEGPGDILVFLSGEREIRDAEEALRGHLGQRVVGVGPPSPRSVELLPLYSRRGFDIEVVVDRLVQKGDLRRRLADSIETALQLADGVAMIEVLPSREARDRATAQGLPEPEPEMLTFSEHLACIDDGLSFEALEPR